MKSKKGTTKTLKNKKMNDFVYLQRKEAMQYIYEARKLLKKDMPRITIRITKNHETILGLAGNRRNTIWITDRAVESKRYDLRTIVYHELLHAWYGVDHDEECPLMKAIHTPLSKEDCQKHFLKWAKKYEEQACVA